MHHQHPPPDLAATHTRAWRHGTLIAEDFPVTEVADQLAADPEVIVWVDLCQPDRDVLMLLGGELSLHELAIEDALTPHQRPKLDRYDAHRFLSIHAIDLDPDTGALDETEVDAFIDARWIITIRKNDRFAIDRVIERWDLSPALAEHGVPFLLYGLLDHVVDQYVVAVDAFDEYYDTISQALFDEHPLDPTKQREWFTMRRSLVRFHRLVVSMREVISSTLHRDENIAGELHHYYQDVYDHILSINETADSLRDLGATIVETNLALRDFRQNQITKQVTGWAAIVAVPTLITGFYGMNVPYPGSGTTTGVVVSTALVIGAPVVLFAFFRRRDWL